MSSKRPKPLPDGGFTLTEVMISLTVLIVVLVLSMSLLFSLRSFAVRQQMFAEPRQAGRQGVEYIAENLRQAGVISRTLPGTEGVVIPYMNGVQASWNNCTDAAVADLNTDVICITRPQAGSSSLAESVPGIGDVGTIKATFSKGCPSDVNNRSMFLEESGALAAPHSVILVDGLGQVALAKIDPWNGSNPVSHCAGSAPDWAGSYISVPSSVSAISGGNAHPDLVDPVYVSSTSFLTLRVKNGRLQQKFGWMDPAAVDDGFVDLLENVVDLQFTYYMRDGAVFNTSSTNRLPDAANRNIPTDPDAADPISCSNVIGVGIFLVTRSAAEAPITMRRPIPFPLLADRTVPPPTNLVGAPAGVTLRRDRMFYNQANANAFIRNRMLGF